jgi:hypothetical protein
VLIAMMSFRETHRSHFRRLGEIVRAEGHEFEEVLVPQSPLDGTGDPAAFKEGWIASWRGAKDLIAKANGLIFPNAMALQDETVVSLLHKRIHTGARVLMFDDPNHLKDQNRFLAFYGMSCTPLVLHSGEGRVEISRDHRTYRDGAIFAGVETVRVKRPTLVVCRGEALPLLVGTGKEFVVDSTTDLEFDVNAGELACAGAWHDVGGGALIAWGGGLLFDSYTGMTGTHFSGIEGNETLAKNITRFLTAGLPTLALPSPEEYARRIEVNLANFVLRTLRDSSPHWWFDCVPEPTRLECAKRHESERNRFPKEAYLDLIDLKSIIEKNWSLFQGTFESAGLGGGKSKALAFLVQLNELRRLVGHPLKMQISGYQFSEADRAFLQSTDALVLRLSDTGSDIRTPE